MLKVVRTVLCLFAFAVPMFCSLNVIAEEYVVPEESQEVRSLRLEDYTTEMKVGEEQSLVVTVLPLGVVDSKLSFYSSDEDVATINNTGRITAIKEGETQITVACDGVSERFLLRVNAAELPVEVTDIEMQDWKYSIHVGETVSLDPKVIQSGKNDVNVKYFVVNSSIARVNSSGVITGVGKGVTSVCITAGEITKTVEVTVSVKTKKIDVSSDYIILKVGQRNNIRACAYPSDAPQCLKYKSTDDSVILVDENGELYANGQGNASVIISNEDCSKAITVIVNKNGDASEPVNSGLKETNVLGANHYGLNISARDVEVIDTDYLRYLYDEGLVLFIQGEGFSLSVDGKRIRNVNHALATDVHLKTIEGGYSFIINNGNPLCGEVSLSIENKKGKYLYLYDDTSKEYVYLSMKDTNSIMLSQPGEYVLLEKKMEAEKQPLIIVIAGGILVVIFFGVYMMKKNIYWFW